MRSLPTLVALAALALPLAVGCSPPAEETRPAAKVFADHYRLGRAFEVRPAPFRTGGFPSNERCMEGNYTYVYETDTPLHGREVWLCCVPVEELLRDSFSCAGEVLVGGALAYIGDADYLKIRFCQLYDAQSTELRLIPACIPAPLEAPVDDDPVDDPVREFER